MSNLVGALSQVTGQKFLDGAGLRGQYDFTLSYVPDRGGAGPEESDIRPAADGFPGSVFTALREQLGLNLETRNRHVEFICC
jgi:uncharacterized protein (TIGR03435 family)